jgi:hypothetical protein
MLASKLNDNFHDNLDFKHFSDYLKIKACDIKKFRNEFKKLEE